MKDKRKPGVPYILEVLNLLDSSDETTTTDEENEINNQGQSEELFHTEDNVNTGNPQQDSENDSSVDQNQINYGPSEELFHTEDNISDVISEDVSVVDDTDIVYPGENPDSEDFFSENSYGDPENPYMISSDSDPSSHSQVTTEFEYDGDNDSDSSDNSKRPFKRRKY